MVGRGTGIDDAMFGAQDRGGRRGPAPHRPRGATPATHLGALASLGGLEIAALAGFIVGAAAAGVPVIVDGVIAAAAARQRRGPVPAGPRLLHRRPPLGRARIAVPHSTMLGLRPLLSLDLRLGEGTGACLALPLVQAAARVLSEMATFDQAGVTSKDAGDS